MADYATTTRTVINVVVRGLPLPEGGRFNAGEFRVLIVRRSRPADWPGVALEKGDLDGIVWVRPEEAFHAAAELQKTQHIVAVRVAMAG